MIKAGIFLHNGLGDGINGLVLANHLHLNGWQVDTYNNVLGSMQSWCPHLSICPYPPVSEISVILASYDLFLIVHHETDPFVRKLIEEGKRRFPDRVKVLYLYASRNIVNEPYYSDSCIDPSLSVVENLRLFCQKMLRLTKLTKSNGFIPPPHLSHRQYAHRIVMHPTSSRPTRNWPKEKFVKLALHLKQQGYEICFVPGSSEEKQWQDVVDLGLNLSFFSTLDELGQFIYESGFLIGNDSGLAHLASSLDIPTLIFARRKTLANLWAPSFSTGLAITPSPWILNIRGLRLRDRYWKQLISVSMAKKGFERLVKKTSLV